jgi:hypothetical protein
MRLLIKLGCDFFSEYLAQPLMDGPQLVNGHRSKITC